MCDPLGSGRDGRTRSAGNAVIGWEKKSLRMTATRRHRPEKTVAEEHRDRDTRQCREGSDEASEKPMFWSSRSADVSTTGGYLRWSEGAQPPASLRRGLTECRPKRYADHPRLKSRQEIT